jgi:hypothetical protein
MKTININEYTHDGELINLDEMEVYEKLLYNPNLYLDKKVNKIASKIVYASEEI